MPLTDTEILDEVMKYDPSPPTLADAVRSNHHAALIAFVNAGFTVVRSDDQHVWMRSHVTGEAIREGDRVWLDLTVANSDGPESTRVGMSMPAEQAAEFARAIAAAASQEG